MTQESRYTGIEPVRSLETGGFLLTEREHSPNWIYPNHAHETTTVGIVYEGACTEIIGRRSQEFVPYSFQLLPAGMSHTYKFGRTIVRCLTIDIKPHRLEEIRQFSVLPDYAVHIREGVRSALLTRLYREFRLTDRISVLTVEGLILEALGIGARQKSRYTSSAAQPLWLRRARDFIHENATEGLSLINVAISAGVHPSYLARTFRKFYGCTVGDYVRRLRVDYAVRELKESDKSLAEIATAAGFYDQSHFTHEFKSHLRMTPAEFRAAFRAGHTNTKES